MSPPATQVASSSAATDSSLVLLQERLTRLAAVRLAFGASTVGLAVLLLLCPTYHGRAECEACQPPPPAAPQARPATPPQVSPSPLAPPLAPPSQPAAPARQPAAPVVSAAQLQGDLDARLIGKAVEFQPNSATLTDAGRRLIEELAPTLAGARGVKIEISGHTDDRGLPADNRALSQRRAEAVAAHLVSLGVPADLLLARGYGPDRPVAGNDTAEGRRRNRRIEFTVAQGGSP